MKNRNYARGMGIIIASFCVISCICAQSISTKYGKVTDHEMEMTSYDKDTTANAVIIYKKGTTLYEYINNDFRVNYQVETKIKILKTEGTRHADISIPYYANDRTPLVKESVIQIDATAYNLENGKVVKTNMKKEFVFKERINDKYMQVKFSIPEVRAGTVIEYKYRILSDTYYQVRSWRMQEEIPTMNSSYEITIPEYFKFNLEMRGGEHIQTKKKEIPFTFALNGGNAIHATASNYQFTAGDIPALKPDTYLWCPEDFTSQINFELNGLEFPGSGYRSFTSTWESIDRILLEEEDFGKLLKMKNPLQAEMSALPLEALSTDAKIAAIFNLLKQKISWNEKYTVFGTDIRKNIKSGTTSNAELNFILISMLRDAGIQAVPVILCRRDQGIIPYTHPTINKINTFVVGIQNSDSTQVFLDGSVVNGFVNVLPPVLQVDRARIVSETGGNKWVNLTRLSPNSYRSFTNATISEDGEIQGEWTTMHVGQYAVSCRNGFASAKDSAAYIEKKETDASMKVLAYKQEGRNDFSPEMKEIITFSKSTDTHGEYLYINPMVFTHIDKNPFTQEERKFPVEFPYPYQVRISSTLTIPESYQVEELPRNKSINLEDDNGSCRYLIKQDGNRIMLTYTFTINKTTFLPTEYSLLKEFWGSVNDMNNEMLVLKKITP